MAASELRSSPSFVEPDVLRSIQLLPGIEARSDWSAGFNVHGGEADQNLILIDGYPIYNPFHLGGLFSTFIDPTVGRVELHEGGMPVRYGERLSGALDVRSAEPSSTSMHGTAEVSLLSSTASIGRAFGDSGGSWMIAARRTYADAVVDLFQPNGFPYHFQDLQAHLVRSLGDGVRVSVTGYDGVDIGGGHGSNGSTTNGSWGNGVLGATLVKSVARPSTFLGVRLPWPADSLVLEQRASLTHFDLHIDINDYLYHARDGVSDLRAAGSATLYSERVTNTLGYEVARQRASYGASSDYSAFADFIPPDSMRSATAMHRPACTPTRCGVPVGRCSSKQVLASRGRARHTALGRILAAPVAQVFRDSRSGAHARRRTVRAMDALARPRRRADPPVAVLGRQRFDHAGLTCVGRDGRRGTLAVAHAPVPRRGVL